MARNRGGRKNKNKNKNRGGAGPLMQQARQETKFFYKPELNAIDREIQNVLDELEGTRQGVESAYGGYSKELGPIGRDYTQSSRDIRQDLIQDFGRLEGRFEPDPTLAAYGAPATAAGGVPLGLPAGEAAAGSQFGEGIGQTALGLLASQRQRQEGFQTSAEREGGLAERAALGNIVQQTNDAVEALRERQLQVQEQFPLATQTRLDDLRQQALENRLVKQSQENDRRASEAFSQLLMGQVGNYLRSDRNRNRGSNRGGGGGGSSPRPGPRQPRRPPRNTQPGTLRSQ